MQHQRPEPVAQRVDRGLVPGLEQHHRGRDDLCLGEGVALVLDAHELRHEQAVRLAALLGDQRACVVDVLPCGSVCRDPGLVVGGQFVHLDDGV
jgi:hypothetical protein